MTQSKLSRRRMLKVLGTGAAGALLAGCQPQAPQAPLATSVPKTGKEIVPAEGTPKPVPEIWVDLAEPGCPGGGNSAKTLAVQKVIQDKTGIKVNSYLRPSGSAGTEKLNLILSSGNQPLDLFQGSWTDFKSTIIPLDDLLKQYGQSVLKSFQPVDWAKMKDADGVTWGFPRLGLLGGAHFPFFRTDWLKEVGMKIPQTWEEMEAVIVAFKKAHPESVVATTNLTDLMFNTLGAFVDGGNSNWIDPADKMLKPVQTHPGYRDWVEKMNQWWKNGWMHKEAFANPDIRALLQTLTVGTWLGWYSRITSWWEDIRINAKYAKEDYGMSVEMTGAKGLLKTNYPGGTSAYMIPRKSKNPEAVMRYVDWMFQGMPTDLSNVYAIALGVEGADWEWVDKKNGMARRFIPTTGKCEERYAGDYWMNKGPGTEPFQKEVLADGTVHRHWGHLNTYWLDYSHGKMPVDADVPYDVTAIRKVFAGEADMNRLFEEETIKFITGVRPLSEWSAFQKQIEGAGLKQWSEQYTAQFRKYHKA